jgi:hypothetical protein
LALTTLGKFLKIYPGFYKGHVALTYNFSPFGDFFPKKNVTLVLLKQNFPKAYNKISWAYSFNAMEKLGMHQEFINLVSLLFKDAKVAMCFNGNITPYFHLHKGVSQSYPLALNLFLVVGDILYMMFKKAIKIRKIRRIKLTHSKGQQTFF